MTRDPLASGNQQRQPAVETHPTYRSLIFSRTGLWIFLTALALRIAYWIHQQDHYFFIASPGADVQYYLEWAENIVHGRTPVRPFSGLPFYAYLLAALYRMSFGLWEAVRFVQLCVGALNCVLLYSLAHRVFGRTTAVTAGLLAATQFQLIHYDWLFMPVPWLVLLGLCAAILLNQEQHRQSVAKAGLIGLMAGLGSLGEPKWLFFVGLLGVWWLIHLKPASRAYRFSLALLLGFGLVIGSVTLRNCIVGKSCVLVSSQSGLSFYAGNNRASRGYYEHPEFMRPDHRGQDEDQKIIAEAVAKRRLTPAQVSAFWWRKAFDEMRRDPLGAIRRFIRKAYLFFVDAEPAYDIDLILQEPLKRRLEFNPFPAIVALGLVGLAASWQRYRHALTGVNLLLAAQWLATIVFFLTNRHRASVLPFFILYQAHGIVWLMVQARRRDWRRLAAGAGVVMSSLLLFTPERLPADERDFIATTKTGEVLYQKKQYGEAAAWFERAAVRRPFDAHNWFKRGNALFHLGRFDEARASYQRALRICPYHVDALYNLGVVFNEQGRYEEALSVFDRVLRLQPDGVDAMFKRMTVLSALGRCDEAHAVADRIRASVPQNILNEFLRACDDASP